MVHERKIHYKELGVYRDKSSGIIFQAYYLMEYGRVKGKNKLRRGLKNQYPNACMFKIEAAIKSAFRLEIAVYSCCGELNADYPKNRDKIHPCIQEKAPCLTEDAYEYASFRAGYILVK